MIYEVDSFYYESQNLLGMEEREGGKLFFFALSTRLQAFAPSLSVDSLT